MNAPKGFSKMIAVILSAALLLSAPGLDCYRALAAGEVAIEAPAGFAANVWMGPVSSYFQSPNATAGNAVSAIVQRFQDPSLSAALRGQAAAAVAAKLDGQPLPSDPATQRTLIEQALSSVALESRADTLSAAQALQAGTLTSESAARVERRLSEIGRTASVYLEPEVQALARQTQSLLSAQADARPAIEGQVEAAARQWLKKEGGEAPAVAAYDVEARGDAVQTRSPASPAKDASAPVPPAPAKAAASAPSAPSGAVSALKALPTLALAAAPIAALAFGGIAVLGLSPAATVALAGFAVGAMSAHGIARSVIARAKLGGPAARGALILGLAAGGAVAGGATLLLASVSPAMAALSVSIAALARRLASAPSASPLARPATGRDAPLFLVVRQDGKRLLALDKSQFGKQYLLSVTLKKGLGEKFLYSGFSSGEFLCYFERVGGYVQLVAKNTRFRAQAGTAQDRAVASSIPDTTLVKAKVVADDPATGLTVVDMDPLFSSDLLRLNPTLDQEYDGQYALDKDLSAVQVVHALPANMEIDARLTFARAPGQPAAADTVLPDAQNLALTIHYSLSELKQDAYTPRLADDRVGHFTTVFEDWTDPQAREKTVRYINRWKLERSDPKAALSPVKEPIVYWMDPTIPEQYRDTVRQAVLKWNKAFEKIGFEGAVVVKDAPEKGAPAAAAPSRFAGVPGAKAVAAFIAKTPLMRVAALKAEVDSLLAPPSAGLAYDSSDARFNVIKWYLAADDAGPAFGPSRANPMTGQIYNANVSFPLLMAGGSGEMDLAEASLGSKTPKSKSGHDHGAGNPADCRWALEASQQAAQALDLLEARSPMTPAQKDKFVRDYITMVILHEVGHTLGLRHNFRAAGWKSEAELGATHDGVVTASVMDYAAANIAAPGKPQGSYFNTDIGPYDYWAIEYAYAPLEGMDAAAQAQALAKIASRSGEPGLEYGTDEDMTGLDPLVQTWYIGKDLLAFAKGRMENVRKMWADIQKRDPEPGQGYQDLYTRFRRGFLIYQRATDIVSQYVGGIYFHRNHVGDAGGKLPFEPVSAEQQRAALAFLNAYVFSDKPFTVDPVFLRKLAPERQSTVENGYPPLGYMPYDRYVLLVRLTALGQMFDPRMLMRLHESRQMAAPGEDVMTIQELFTTLTQDIFAEALAKKEKPSDGMRYVISPLRRSLQQAYVQQLVLTAFGGVSVPEASAAAQQNALLLMKALQSELQSGVWDYETQAHLAKCMMTIKSGMEMGPLLARRRGAGDD